MPFQPSLVSLVALVSTAAYTAAVPAAAKPAAFFLAGDSTTAVQSAGGGGWGTGFLTKTLINGATGINFGHNGATTVSFRAGGDWANVLAAAEAATACSTPYVTIQFGHNDQKPDKNISSQDLTANLVNFVDEVRAVNAIPILVTSLSRRSFSNGIVVENLADVVAATEAAAAQTNANIIDLNAASTTYLNAIGKEKAVTYNLKPTDNTHLNSQGSDVFGSMVAGLIKDAVAETQSYLQPEQAIADAIANGTYYFPPTCEGQFCA